MAFGFSSRQMQGPSASWNPWSGLPAGGAPWGGSPNWQAAQQAPWRLSPWQTQAMPSAAPMAPPSVPAPSPYLGQGVSGDIPGFQPGIPGGGFYPQQPAPVAPAAPSGGEWYYGGAFHPSQEAALSAYQGSMTPGIPQSTRYDAPQFLTGDARTGMEWLLANTG